MEFKVTRVQLMLMFTVLKSDDVTPKTTSQEKDIHYIKGISSTSLCSKLDFCGRNPVFISVRTKIIISTDTCSPLRHFDGKLFSCCNNLLWLSKVDVCHLENCTGYPDGLFAELEGNFNIITIFYVCGKVIKEDKKDEDSKENHDSPIAGYVAIGLSLALVTIVGSTGMFIWRRQKHAFKATRPIPFSKSRDGSNMQNNTHALTEYHHNYAKVDESTSNTRIDLCLHANETVPAKRDTTYITPLHNEYADIEEGTSNSQVAASSRSNGAVPANTDDNYITPLHNEYAEIEDGASNTKIVTSSCSNESLPAETDDTYIIPIL